LGKPASRPTTKGAKPLLEQECVWEGTCNQPKGEKANKKKEKGMLGIPLIILGCRQGKKTGWVGKKKGNGRVRFWEKNFPKCQFAIFSAKVNVRASQKKPTSEQRYGSRLYSVTPVLSE